MKMQWREIGESDWHDCDKKRYDHCNKSPEHDTRIVNKETNPVKRLHNLCDALQEQQDDSPYSANAWRDIEIENTRLRNETCCARSRLQCIWEHLQEINKDTGLEPPKHFLEWFDTDGVPKSLDL